jgi:hypothetical protein
LIVRWVVMMRVLIRMMASMDLIVAGCARTGSKPTSARVTRHHPMM